MTLLERILAKPVNQILLLVVLVWVAYGNTLFHQFVFDDHETVEFNRLISSLHNLPLLLSRHYFDQRIEISYRPVVTLSYFVDYFFWGTRPVGYHLTNVLLHLATVVAVFLLLCELLAERTLALYGALVFALHPVQTEVVNVISYREDLLATGMCIFAMLSYITLRKSGRIGSPLGALPVVCYILAAFAKESAVVLPVLIAVVELPLFRHRFGLPPLAGRSRFWIAFAFATALVFYAIIRFLVMVPYHPMRYAYFGGSLGIAEMNFPRFFLFYWWLLLVPVRLCAEYAFQPIVQLSNPVLLLGIAGTAGYLALIIILVRRRVALSAFGLVWVIVAILPVAQILPFANPVAERYLYFPMAGFALILATVVQHVAGKLRAGNETFRAKQVSTVIIIVCGIQLLAYTYITTNRNPIWSRDETLWPATYKCEPRGTSTLTNLGALYLRRGELAVARGMFEQVLKYMPHNYVARNNLGVVYMQRHDYARAIEELRKALWENPAYPNAHYNLALCYAHSDPPDYRRAAQHLELARAYHHPVPQSVIDEIEHH
jgi:hypothetical protein